MDEETKPAIEDADILQTIQIRIVLLEVEDGMALTNRCPFRSVDRFRGTGMSIVPQIPLPVVVT